MAPTLDSGVMRQSEISFARMLEEVRKVFSQPDCRVDVDELWRVLESYKSDPRDWSKFAYYEMHKYKRNLVDEDDRYNVMILSWAPNTKSCIHDHSGSHCFMKVLDGELIESRFAWPESNENGEMNLISKAQVGENEVLYINDKVGLHQVENPNPTKSAASLHVYIPPILTCRAFDEKTGKSRDCKLTFFSKRGRIVGQED